MFRNYLKIAIRNLQKNKAFALINILGLTLGITCSLGIFMIIRHELSFDGFHPNKERIYRVVTETKYPEGSGYTSGIPYPLVPALKLDFQRLSKVTMVSASVNNQVDIIDVKSGSSNKRFKEEKGIFYTDPAFFDIFHFNWLYGDANAVLSKPNSAALTKETAEKYFGSWQNAIGKSIKKDNKEVLQVEGIVENPPTNTDFQFKILVSDITQKNHPATQSIINDWGTVSSSRQCYVLLPPDYSAEQMTAQMPGFRKKYLDNTSTDYYLLQKLSDIHFDEQFTNFNFRTISKQTLLSLSLIGIFLLLLACINFINLATAQAIRRSREIGIRKVLGSHRIQLAIQFFGETLIIVIASAILATALVTLLSPLSQQVLNRPVPMNPLYSPVTIGFVLLLLFLVTVLSSFYPAIILSGFKPIQALKNKITSKTVGGISLRRALVIFQFIIAQGLIIATLVVITQINFFNSAPLGFDKEAIVNIELPRDSVSKELWDVFRQKLLQQTGVIDVSLSFETPSSRSNQRSSFYFNKSVSPENFDVNIKLADVNYLKTYQIQLLAGRPFTLSDTITEYLVNETFLQKTGIKNPRNALGKFVSVGNHEAPIVGVIKDFNQRSLHDPVEPVVLASLKNNYRVAGVKLSAENMQQSISNIEKIFSSLFPAYIFESRFLDESIARFYEQEKGLSVLFKWFALTGIFISCIGLYGLILFMTTQRTKEVGVRKVLGASVRNIVMMFFKEFLNLIAIAFIIASPLTWYFMNNWLNDFAFRINITWWMFAIVGIASILLAFITISFQTLKTAIISPVKSLRME